MSEQTPLSLSELAQDAHSLPLAQFEAKHGVAFLVLAGALDTGLSPHLRTLTDHDNVGGNLAAGDTLFVFPVRAKASNVFPDFISVGRASNNDVVVLHPSVSKFHAYMRKHQEGLALYDAASANGTFANEDRVAVKGRGSPALLTSGVSVRFGTVNLMFLNGEALQKLAQTLIQHVPEAVAAAPAKPALR